VHDHAAVHAAHDADQPLGFEDAQRLAQRRPRHAEALDQVGFTSERLALGELPADNERAQFVGDLLRFLAQSSPVALAGSHLNHPASPGVETSGGYQGTSPLAHK
jgi:hypothetical protein